MDIKCHILDDLNRFRVARAGTLTYGKASTTGARCQGMYVSTSPGSHGPRLIRQVQRHTVSYPCHQVAIAVDFPGRTPWGKRAKSARPAASYGPAVQAVARTARRATSNGSCAQYSLRYTHTVSASEALGPTIRRDTPVTTRPFSDMTVSHGKFASLPRQICLCHNC